MVELISKWAVVDKLTALENEFQHYKPFHGFEHAMYRKLVEVEMEIGKTPPVEAEPVVHAHWVGDPGDWHCSHCDAFAPDGGYEQTKRCPNCGAHMDEEVVG